MQRPDKRFIDSYDSIKGIRDSWCFMSFDSAVIGMRPWDCWCSACCNAEGKYHGMDSYGKVIQCKNRSTTDFEEMSVRRIDSVGVRKNMEDAQKEGRVIAEKLKIGDLVAVQNRGHQDYDDQYWVGVVVDSGNHRAITQKIQNRSETVGTGAEAVGFNRGDYVIHVRWYQRDTCDEDRQTFYLGEAPKHPSVVNSTELRKGGFKMEKRPAPVKPQYNFRHVMREEEADVEVEELRWLLKNDTEQAILRNCHYNV